MDPALWSGLPREIVDIIIYQRIMLFGDFRLAIQLAIEPAKIQLLRTLVLSKRWDSKKIDELELSWLIRYNLQGHNGWTLSRALAMGRLAIVEHLFYVYAYPRSYPFNDNAEIDVAAAGGQRHVVQWLHEHGGRATGDAMDLASQNGRLEVVKFLHKNRHEGCSTDAMDKAASGGHLEVVKWLHKHRQEGCTPDALDEAAGSGHLAVVQWLHRNRQEGATTEAMDYAAAWGDLAMLQWLHAHRQEGCTTSAMNMAAAGGHLAVVEWLHENRHEGCYGRGR
ncbi:hypothetical protein HDU87_000165 [Geranomyces variabilis]|uniref:Ankyrin repeat protein n=1 Tax=Geranomyces variabilis TaxID=109894 RepID=A0AAD5TSF4_9FUNG|nr:hypothetical protein HDU87_000165 [Geranomyces variabilis]